MARFRVKAYHDREGNLQHVQANAYVPDREEAQRIAAQFPKSTRVRATSVSGPAGEFNPYSEDPRTRTWGPTGEAGSLYFHADLSPTTRVGRTNERTGGVNETGMKRYRTFRQNAEKLGHTVEWGNRDAQNHLTEDEFESRVKAQFNDRRS